MGRKYKFCDSPLPGESLLCYYVTLGDKVVFERWLEGEDMGLDKDGNPILYSDFGVEYTAKGWHPPLLWRGQVRTHHFGGDELERQKADFRERMERVERLAAYAAAVETGGEIPYREDCNLLDQRTVEFLMKMKDSPEFISAIEMVE